MPSQERIQYHTATGRDYLAKAWTYLDADDLNQASEKGWGAAAQMIKAAAETRDWSHDGHRQLWQTVNRLSEETGDQDIGGLFSYANSLHINFYDGLMPRELVESYLERVAELVDKLDRLDERQRTR